MVKAIPEREGFPRVYSFVCGAAGNQYVASTDRKRIERIAPDGRKSVVAKGFSNIRWIISKPDATLYFVDARGGVKVITRSSGIWSPAGGAFAPNGDLLLLEVSVKNDVRLRRLPIRSMRFQGF